MLLRIASSSSAAIVVTAALLLIMAGFIARDAGPRLSPPRIEFPAWIYEPPPPPVVQQRQRPKEPPKPATPPPFTRTTGGETEFAVIDPTPGEPTGSGGQVDLRFGISDGDLLPIVTIAPTYPPTAERRGLEGYVIVDFTVDQRGNVENAHVTESSHSVFERAALDAAMRFRFRPRVIDGQAVAVHGVRRRMTFTLED